MTERVVEVRTVLVHMDCDVYGCGGEMKSTGCSKMSSPPQNEHQCTKCQLIKFFRGTKYPHISYRGINEPD